MRANKIMMDTMNKIQLQTNLKDIFQSFKHQIQNHIIKSMSYSAEQLKNKYHVLCKKYQQNVNLADKLDWLENQKKIFISLLLVFCYLNTKKISQITDNQWILFSEAFNNKNVLLLKYELHSIQKRQLRVRWNRQSQSLLQQCISSQQNIEWTEISHFIFFQSQGKYFQTPKQCRQHWFNHLDTKIVKGNWSIAEDLIILETVMQKGKKWAQMMSLLENRRTEHMIKNRFNSLMTCAKKFIKTNDLMSQNEIIAFMKQKLIRRRQHPKTHWKQKKCLQNQKQEINLLTFNIPPVYQFHLSNNQNQQNVEDKQQINALKIQFCDQAQKQENFKNFNNNLKQEMGEKIKIQHIEASENAERNQESLIVTLPSNINRNQGNNIVGYYPNQFYTGQSYAYYLPTIIYPLI